LRNDLCRRILEEIIVGILKMNILLQYVIALLTTSCTLFVLAVFVYLKNRKGEVNKAFVFYSLCITIWSLGQALHNSATDKFMAIFWARYFHAGVIFISTAFVHFTLTLLELDKIKHKLIKTLYIISFVFLFFNFTPLFIPDAVPKFSLNYYWTIGPIYPFFLAFWIAGVSYSLYKLFKTYRISLGTKRNQLKYLFWSTLFGYIGGSANYLPAFNLYLFPLNPFGTYAVPLYSIVVAYVIVKYRLMDIKIAVTRAGIFLAVYTFVLVLPFLGGYYTKSWIVTGVFMFALATIGPAIYRVIQRKAENILLAKQKRYQKVLLDAAKGMVREHDLGRLLKLIVHVVRRTVKIEFAAIFIEDKEKEIYRLAAVRDHDKVPANFTISYGHPLIEVIKQKRRPLLYEDIPPSIRDVSKSPMHLVVPSMIRDKLLSFLILGEKQDRTIYTEEDIGVFYTLSRQAALAIEHCLFLKEFKEAQEKIFQAEKLASIGGMASGIAHQIRNRLNHFAVAVGELKLEFKDMAKKQENLIKSDPAFKESVEYGLELAESIDKNVKRTANMITGMLDFAQVETEGSNFSQFSLKEIADLTIVPLKTKHNIDDLPLEFDFDGDDTIGGIKSQFVEVVLNILDNAYEAIKEKGELRLSEEEKAKYQPFIKINLDKRVDNYLIKISDNGVGVKEEDQQKVFAPFFTTKSSAISGTGIGMYVVKRMIEENHSGKIWFESKYMEGTTFYIELPKKEGRDENNSID
jgi:signal transduction histidine kinase